MDPDACLAELRNALSVSDRESARDAAQCLRDWLAGGGFPPEDIRGAEMWRLIRAGLRRSKAAAQKR